MFNNKKCKDCYVKTNISSFGFCLKCHIKNKLCMKCGDGPFITIDENNSVSCFTCIETKQRKVFKEFLTKILYTADIK